MLTLRSGTSPSLRGWCSSGRCSSFSGSRWRRCGCAKCDVVENLFDALHVVLERVVASAERVVLQLQQTEAGVELLQESVHSTRTLQVACHHRVHAHTTLQPARTNVEITNSLFVSYNYSIDIRVSQLIFSTYVYFA